MNQSLPTAMLTGKNTALFSSASYITEAVEFANKNFVIGYEGLGKICCISLKETKNVPACIKNKKKEIIEQNNFESWLKEYPNYSDHIVFVDDKADLVNHTDDLTFKNFHHMRANWIVQTPIGGGKIMASGVEFETKLNDVCVLNALELHRVTKVIGKIPLILYTFGFIKEKSDA